LAGLTSYPILILKEGHKRDVGKDAQRKNILAARALTEAVRTTLGPKGMDKMLVDNTGDVVITNDGATILWEMDVQHPVAKMIVEVARTLDDEVGDGTTTAVLIAGELLKNAESLLDQGVHPTVIIKGYKQASVEAQKILRNMAIRVSKDEREILKKVAQTAMTGKGIEVFKERLSSICMDAAFAIAEDGKVDVEERVKIVKATGGSIKDTVLNYGIVLEKERLTPEMPKRIENAKIALFDGTLELKKLSTDAKVKITDVSGLQSLRDGEERIIAQMVEALAKTGANVIFCQKGIGLSAQHYLTKHGILGLRRISDEEIKMLALATGGKIVGDLLQIKEADLGHAELVEQRKVAREQMIFVEGCQNPKAVSIIVHGGTEILLDNIERALHDALCAIGDVLKSERVVPGGGAAEVEVAERIKEFASTITGRDQLAARSFADAIEVIPITLAENAGLDPIDILVKLRSKHEAGFRNYGVSLPKGEPADMIELGVFEPLQAIKSAVEAASSVLRVDDVIAAKRGELTPKLGQSPHDYTRVPPGLPGMM
jgi:thermosome